MTYKNVLATVLLSTSLLGGMAASAAEQPASTKEEPSVSQSTEAAKFKGVEKTAIVEGDKFDAKKDVEVVNAKGDRIDADIKVAGKVDTHKVGTYQLTYTAKVDDQEIQSKRAVKVEPQKKETVTYNGKTMSLPVGPSDVKETKVTAKTQGVMGQTAQNAAKKARTDVLHFTLGNPNVPDVDFIDVSSYQPNISVDTFKLMKSRGVKGVVVKLTEGTNYRNPYAPQQIKNAKAAGLKVSAYHFSRFKNKAQAQAEARYFAAYAQELGLPKSTVMVNDMEAAECNNGYATSNSVYFALELIQKCKYSTVLHYGYQSWFDTGVLNANTLGKDSIWIASYPYTPSKNDLWFKGQYEAWQFSSTMTVPGYTANTFDANIDYTGRFTHTVSKAYELNDFYVTVDKKGYNAYGDKALSAIKNSTSNLYHQTFKAERYYLINGKKYYSLYNQNDEWQGYVSADAIREAGDHGQGGAYFGQEGKYATVKTSGYDMWSDFDFKGKKGVSQAGERYEVRALYYHFNGTTYASVYDKEGNWKGYVDVKALEIEDNDFGPYQSFGKYMTVVNSGYGIFKDKNFEKQVSTSDKQMNRTYFVKGYYDRFTNGRRYYSLYSENEDGSLKWEGYIGKGAMKMGYKDGASKGGAYFGQEGKYATVAKDDYTLWGNFDFTERKGVAQKDECYEVRALYHHINGATYASLYDREGNWKGYINTNALTIEDNDFGPYHSYRKYVTIDQPGYGIYKDKNFKNKVSSSDEKMHKTYLARGYYDRFTDGKRYYSLYSENEDGDLKWVGYIDANAAQLGNDDGASKGGAYFAQKDKYATVKKADYTLWRNFNFSAKKGVAQKGQTYQVRGLYYHINGATYATVYDKDGNWKGYINTNALAISDTCPW